MIHEGVSFLNFGAAVDLRWLSGQRTVSCLRVSAPKFGLNLKNITKI